MCDLMKIGQISCELHLVEDGHLCFVLCIPKRLDFNNCTGPNKVCIELKISKINNRIDLN